MRIPFRLFQEARPRLQRPPIVQDQKSVWSVFRKLAHYVFGLTALLGLILLVTQAVLPGLALNALPEAQAQRPLGNLLFQPVLGEQRVLMIRVVYPDEHEVVLSNERAPLHAEQLKAVLERNSYGKATFNFEFTPMLTMPQPSAFYETEEAFLRIRADAVKLAEQAGFPLKNYDREIIFTTKHWSQPWTGHGYINFRTAFMACDCVFLSAHEVGHTFDWQHATYWRVSGNNPISLEGREINYGDGFDIMGDQVGKPRSFHHFSPWYKMRAGWLAPENVLTVTEPGIYTVQTIERTLQDGYAALRLRKDAQNEYWIFYRSQEEFANRGAIITWIRNGNYRTSRLLDMHPRSRDADYLDAALSEAEVFLDPEAGIAVRLIERTPDFIRLEISVKTAPIDQLPVINVISPKLGKTISGAVTYEVTAYDPDVDNSNGAGIESLTLSLVRFSDDDTPLPPVAEVTLTHPPYVMHLDTAQIEDANYPLLIMVTASDGGVSTAIFKHIVDNTGPSF